MPAAAYPSLALVLSLLTSAPAAMAQEPGTSQSQPSETEHILDAMHEYAASYVSALPDFLCLQVTEQFQAGKKGDRWRQLDSLTSKLVFANGQEHRTLQLINGHPPALGHASHRPLITNGEFAILIANIFSESSQAHFEWKGWTMLKDQRCAVFSYSIEQQHSTMKLGLSDLATAVVPYRGFVFADPASGAIRRVTNMADEIPPEVRTRSIATTIDYAPVTVGTISYLLPSDASVEIAIPSGRIRNELHFRDYQKFDASSTITFDAEGDSTEKKAHPPE